MRWIARITAFTAALVFGSFVASFFVASESPGLDMTSVVVREHLVGTSSPLRAADLLGTWKGSWGYNSGDCTIKITRVDGEAFFGTLRKDGAEILVQGTIEAGSRAVFFEETKVVRLGANMSVWSLGENRGYISTDGRIMYGTGVDEWGQYAWAVSNQ